uniref:Uncharacterized protein n=1 Tax=Cacopsylla melanoneura TaxID=428564 RepID=A0A8D8UQH9_9HEMI
MLPFCLILYENCVRSCEFGFSARRIFPNPSQRIRARAELAILRSDIINQPQWCSFLARGIFHGFRITSEALPSTCIPFRKRNNSVRIFHSGRDSNSQPLSQ